MKTRRTDSLLHAGACMTAALVGSLFVAACEKPAPPPPPPPPKKAEAPPPPEPVRTDSLLQTMKADARVQFPQSAAPSDEVIARAVISFADALARGDSDKFKTMLDPGGKAVLDKLVAGGQWEESTGKSVEAVRVAKLTASADSGVLMLAIQEPRGAYPLAWAVSKVAGTAIFTALPISNVVKTRASEFDTLAITPGVDAPMPAGTESAAAAPSDDAPGADKSAKKPEEKPEAAPDDGSRTRSTPNGKVKIPGRPSGG